MLFALVIPFQAAKAKTLSLETVIEQALQNSPETARILNNLEDAAWNYVAMEQAIADAGLEENDIINPMTGLIMGSGGPSTRTLVEAADTTRDSGPKRIGPFAVPKCMSSTNSATLATPFGIKGINLRHNKVSM